MRLLVPRDIDGFFGLFVDNLVQLLLIVQLTTILCGMSGDQSHFVYQRILPGAAVSILLGNIFYAWQAHRLAGRTGRKDVTALPYGINTVSLLIFVFFVMVPVYQETKSAEAAWRAGLIACLGSGLIEFVGSFFAERIRKSTPRAALLSTLAGIAIGFIAMSFALQIWTRPIVALAPLAIVLVTYFSNVRLPLGLPGGFLAIVVGTAIGWGVTALGWLFPDATPLSIVPSAALSPEAVAHAWEQRAWTWPHWWGNEVMDLLKSPAEWLGYLTVIVPMGIFNVIGSLQNIESAEAAGDPYDTRSSLAVNGIGTIIAALFGSCFPTTIYIGHPGWKGLGARAGYSTLNGLAITLICFTGTVALVQSIVPMEAAVAIVLWIGIVITAQAFQSTPYNHAPAVALGLFPAIAAWGATVTYGAFMSAGGKTLQEFLTASPTGELNGYLLQGLLVTERGYIFTCMIIAAISACLVDRAFRQAAIWSVIAAVLTLTGMMHAYQLSGNVIDYLLLGTSAADGALTYRAYDVAIGYVTMAIIFFWFSATNKSIEATSATSPHDGPPGEAPARLDNSSTGTTEGTDP
ncbi:hypothetical protein Pan216_40290 [Planctomycetes bacterium Pan216]|uniref:Permease n=1 Tax=Kolteria novifilia TaxID=2527975 RepID=A0A518B847_9BACT|nr:hypothetical protein Pan216_40290 [Planctomycetes bacterium Pan216]